MEFDSSISRERDRGLRLGFLVWDSVSPSVLQDRVRSLPFCTEHCSEQLLPPCAAEVLM